MMHLKAKIKKEIDGIKYEYEIEENNVTPGDIMFTIKKNKQVIISGNYSIINQSIDQALDSIFLGILPAEEDNPLRPKEVKKVGRKSK